MGITTPSRPHRCSSMPSMWRPAGKSSYAASNWSARRLPGSKKIVVGNDAEAFNGVRGVESGWVPVSVVSPSILTAQVELQTDRRKPEEVPYSFVAIHGKSEIG
jgi:hypothetical protein